MLFFMFLLNISNLALIYFLWNFVVSLETVKLHFFPGQFGIYSENLILTFFAFRVLQIRISLLFIRIPGFNLEQFFPTSNINSQSVYRCVSHYFLNFVVMVCRDILSSALCTQSSIIRFCRINSHLEKIISNFYLFRKKYLFKIVQHFYYLGLLFIVKHKFYLNTIFYDKCFCTMK